jgi:Predicted dehydrogenases and related proteins
MISARRVGPFVWRMKDVGAIVDSASHDIDIARYLTGREPEVVFAKKGKYRHEKEDHAVIVLDFGQTTATVEVNWFTPQKIRTLVVTGSKGVACLDYLEQKVEIYSSEYKLLPNIVREEPLKLEIRHFLDCIENNREPLVSGEEGMKTLLVALKAAGTGK